MASSDARSKKTKKTDNFRHTCGLCMESYHGRNPKILPCFHTFCLPCLTALAEKATTQEDLDGETDETGHKASEGEEGIETDPDKAAETEESSHTTTEREGGGKHGDGKGPRFLCPTCRAPVEIPEGGVAALQTNFYLEHEETEETPAKSLQCQMCDEEEGEVSEASFTCDKCCQRMCRTCRRLHDKFTDARYHHVREIDVSDGSPIKPKRMCSTHRDQELCFHCQKCDVSICLHCKLTSHEGHTTEDVATAVLKAKEAISTLLTKAREQLPVLEASVCRLDQDEMELKRQKEEVTQQIKSRYDMAIMWITRARDELLETLATKEQLALSSTLTEKNSAQRLMDSMSAIMSRCSRNTDLGPDLTVMKNELQQALLRDDLFDRYKVLGNRKEQLKFFHFQADSSALDICMTKAYMGQLMDGEDGDPGERPFRTMQDLAATVSVLESQLKDMSSVQTTVSTLESKLKDVDVVQTTVSTLQSKMKDVDTAQKMISALQSDLDDVKASKAKKEAVSFHARMNNGGSFATSGQKLIFNNAVSNIGSGYDSGTGIFTAPETGVYMFFVTFGCNIEEVTAEIKLVLEGSELAITKGNVSSTSHAIVKVEKGKRVWVETNDSRSFTCLWVITTFTGALLKWS